MALEKDKLSIEIDLSSEDARKEFDALSKSLENVADAMKDARKPIDQTEDAIKDAGDASEDAGDKFEKTGDQAEDSFDKQSKGAKKAGDSQKGFKINLASSFKALTAINQGLEIGIKAYKAIKGVIDATTKAYGVQEKAEIDLKNALKIRGDFSQAAFQDMKDFASQLQATSTFGDETTLGLLKLAKAQGFSNERAKEAVKAAAALAAATGKGLATSFDQVIRSTTGMAGKLKEMGPEFANLTKEQLVNGEAIDVLNDKFGEFTATLRDTFSGKQLAAANAYGDVVEEIGELFVDVFDLGTGAKELETFFVNIGTAIDNFRLKLLFVLERVDFDKLLKPLKELAQFIMVVLTPALVLLVVPLALVAIKIVAITASILAIIVVMDLLVRNADQMGAVFEVMGSAMAVGIAKGAEAFGVFVKFVIEKLGDLNMLSLQNGLINGDVAETIQTGLNNAATSVTLSMETMRGTADIAAEDMKKSFSKLKDKGLLGGLIDTVSDVKDALDEFDNFSDAQTSVDGLTESTAGLNAEAGKVKLTEQQIAAILKEQTSIRDGMIGTNNALQQSIDTFGKGQIERLKIKQKLDTDAVTAKIKQLELEGKLTGEMGKQIEAAAALQKEKINVQAGQQIEQASSGPNVVSPDIAEGLGTVLGQGAADMASGIGGAISSMSNPVGMMMAAADAIGGAVKSLLEFIPKMLNMIADILNMITELPMKILEALQNVFGAIIKLIGEGIKNFIEFLPQLFKDMIKFAFQDLPDILLSVLKDLPGIFIDILENDLPDIIVSLIDGLVAGMPEIAISLAEGLIKAAPKIAIALAKAMAITIPMAIIKGLKKAFGRLFKGIKVPSIKLPDIKPFIKQVEKVIDKVGEGAAKIANKAFAVIDLDADAKELTKVPKTSGEAIEQAKKIIEVAGKAQEAIWGKIMEALKKVWLWIWNKILKPIIGALKKVWLFVWKLISPFIKALKQVWLFIYKSFILPIVKVVKLAFKFVADIFSGLGSVVSLAFEAVLGWGDVLKETAKEAFSVLTDFTDMLVSIAQEAFGVLTDFTDMLKEIVEDAFSTVSKMFDGLKNLVTEAFDVVINFFKNIFKGNIAEAFKGVFDFFKRIPELLKDTFKPAIDFYNRSFGRLVKFFTDSLMPFYKNTFGKLVDFFKNSLMPFYKNSFGRLVDFFKNDLAGVFTKAIEPLVNLFNGLKKVFADSIKPLLEVFDVSNIAGIFNKVFDALNPGNLLDKMFNFAGIDTKFTELFDKLNPLNAMNKIFSMIGGQGKTSTVEDLIGIDVPFVSFAKGGVVPGSAQFQGDHLKNDTVAAMLSPGEAVIPRSFMEKEGIAQVISAILDNSLTFRHKKQQGGVSIPHSHTSVSVPPLTEIAKQAEQAVGDFASDPAGSLESLISKGGEELKAGLQAVMQTVLPGLFDPIKFLKNQIGGALRLMMEATGDRAGFSNGGLVGTDTVPAALTPGEFVLNRNATQGIGAGNAEFINRTGTLPNSGTVQNITITIEPGAIVVDGARDPLEVADEIVEQIRRRTSDGELIVSQNGVFAS